MRLFLVGVFVTGFACARAAQPSNGTNVTASAIGGESPQPTATPAYVTYVSVTKDVVNALFFALTMVLGVLTYRQAKRTIFTPLRTETFKLQLKAFEDVSAFFEKHPTMSIDDEFDFEGVVELNAAGLLNEYALCFFNAAFTEEEVRRATDALEKQTGGARVTEEYMEKHFDLPTHLKSAKQTPSSRTTDAVSILASWRDYKHGMIRFTKRFQEASEKLRRFRASPLLPADLKKRIEEFETVVSKNIDTVGEVMNEVAKELPAKYPNLEEFKKVDRSWIWNRYNSKRVPLADAQGKILEFLSDYLQIEKLLPKRA